ncbi:DNA gyrase subunit A [Candidatus Methanarcanum hacksteinii]|uniref:DNA gyrase subunit A n=1 Tax=Candidatus Methanarcanum hacksteinii TaxID=2911857 RepID=UPI0037DDC00A
MADDCENDTPIRDQIIAQPIEREMSRSYVDYSMSVIVGRALPDVRDGLKPVHRRILYAMNDLGIPYNRPHKKSARIVGEVLGKYHPHGDTAVYDAMVRMAQPFSLRYPLVDGQGNFGSVDGDSAAAMRYTEARLTKMSADMLADIDKDTIDFVDNFDGSLKEPVVLPSKVPNLLVNGSAGIAVGMATNMPPHNLSEVVDATIYAIDNPDADVPELMQFIKGPDFPTGGIIHGLGGIISAYKTGRGKIKVRSKTHFEEKSNGKAMIIVDEIPYQVNKERLIEQIADAVRNKDIEGITNVNDESDKDGMRIVIELHKDAMESVVLENLFKHTQMEITFGVINLALVNNKPMQLTLRELIRQYIEHRKEVVKRRTAFDLDVARKRYHILEGLMAAINRMDEVIELIRASKNADEASEGLQNLLSIDADQAKAILDMKLQKLTGLEIDGVIGEYNDIKKLMIDLEDILAHEGRVLQIIKDELVEMKEGYGDERRTEIDPNAIDSDEEDLIPREEVVITITKDNYIKRIPLRTYKQQGRGGVGLIGMQTKEEDDVANMFVTCTHDYIMFITNTGRLHWLKGYKIPEGSRQSKGKPIVNMLPDLEDGEKVVNTISVSEFTDDKALVFCTKSGIIKKTILSAYGNIRSRGIKAIKLEEGDELISTGITDDTNEIVIATKHGQAARFDEFEVRATGRDTMGVKGITLSGDDEVVGMTIVKPEDMILSVSENGFGKISVVDEYRKTHRGSKGVITMKTTERNGSVVAISKVCMDDELMVTSKQGKMIRIKVSEIRVTGRNAAGVKIMDMRNDDKIIALQAISSVRDDDEIEEPDA